MQLHLSNTLQQLHSVLVENIFKRKKHKMKAILVIVSVLYFGHLTYAVSTGLFFDVKIDCQKLP